MNPDTVLVLKETLNPPFSVSKGPKAPPIIEEGNTMGKVALPVVPEPPFDTDPHWMMNVLSFVPLRKGIFRYPLPDKSPVIPFRLEAVPKPTFEVTN